MTAYDPEWYLRNKEKHKAVMRQYYWDHREERLAYARSERGRARRAARPVMKVAGQMISIRDLPPEWQPVALMVRETRALMRARLKESRNGNE